MPPAASCNEVAPWCCRASARTASRVVFGKVVDRMAPHWLAAGGRGRSVGSSRSGTTASCFFQ